MSREKQTEARQRLEDELSDAIRLSQTLSQGFDELAARKLGVNLTDLRCIDAVQRLGTPTAGEVASETGLSSGAMTAVIDRLEKAGYLTRVPDPGDRRRVRLALTADGTAKVSAIWEPLATAYRAQVAAISDEQLRWLLDFMGDGAVIGREQITRLRAELDADAGAGAS